MTIVVGGLLGRFVLTGGLGEPAATFVSFVDPSAGTTIEPGPSLAAIDPAAGTLIATADDVPSLDQVDPMAGTLILP
jgi:hypothetical protein